MCMAKELTKRELKFIQYYIDAGLNDDSAADAARKAGYAESGIYVTACRMLKKPEIKQAIDKARQRRNYLTKKY